MSKKQFAKLMRSYRMKKNMSITDLANEIGISRTYVSLIESGKRDITLQLRAKLIATTKLPKKILNDLLKEKYDL
jgi:transcriptional regulator with XRE-family HTH domain